MKRICCLYGILPSLCAFMGVLGALCLSCGCSSGWVWTYVEPKPPGSDRNVYVQRTVCGIPDSVRAASGIDVPVDTLRVLADAPVSECPDPGLRMGIRSNLLMDAVAIPNVGVEVAFGKGFLLDAEWFYAWWRDGGRNRFWRVYGGNVGLRRYFRASAGHAYTGHHVGVYGGVFTFCYEWGGNGYLGGLPGHGLWDRCMVNAGLEYGYTLPLGRRINMDFSLGVGYVGGIIEKYAPRQGEYLRLSAARHHWFGPTRAAVSLVWLIGPGNFNERKGGGR